MEPHHRQALQRHLVVFMEDVDVDAGIVRHLQSAGILNAMMVEEIAAYESKTKRALALVQMLPKRGPRAFATFVDALRQTGHEQVAERLVKDVNFNNAEPTLTTSPVYLSRRQDTPRAPNVSEPNAPPSSPINAMDFTDESDFEHDLPEQHLRMKAYTMDQQDLGNALIINNCQFHDTQLNREHGEKDANQLNQVLQQIGFSVLLKQNLVAQEMQETVAKFCQPQRHMQGNCALIAISSHATTTGIMGCDGTLYSTQSLLSSFCDVPSLLNKPKICLIDACVGTMGHPTTSKSRCGSAVSYAPSFVGDSRVLSSLWSKSRPVSGMLSASSNRSRLSASSNQSSRASASSSTVRGGVPSANGLRQSYSAFLNPGQPHAEFMDIDEVDDGDTDFVSVVPTTTDLFIMRSTVEQLVPWKSVVEGCVLLQCFSRVLTNYHKNTDVFGLYKMTKELVAMKEFRAQDEDGRIKTYRQSVEAVDRLKHLLFFRTKPPVQIPRMDSEIEVIDLDACASPRDDAGEGGTARNNKEKRPLKHVKFEPEAQVIETDSKGRVVKGKVKEGKSRICSIL